MNSYKAVQLAESIRTAKPAGAPCCCPPTSSTPSAAPGSAQGFTETITNTGADTQTVHLQRPRLRRRTRTCRPAVSRSTTAPAPRLTDERGCRTTTAEFHFTVKPGPSPPDRPLAWPGNPASCLQRNASPGFSGVVGLILVDPAGHFAAYSIPQGPGNSGARTCATAAAGTWTGVIFSDTAAAAVPMAPSRGG